MTEKSAATPESRPGVSALVTTFNEERHIGECLETLDWCDEVLVVDSYSTDKTPEIAQSFPKVRFLQRTYFGSASQKNWAMDQAEFDWILIMDADERVTPKLKSEILEILEAGPKFDTYTINTSTLKAINVKVLAEEVRRIRNAQSNLVIRGV